MRKNIFIRTIILVLISSLCLSYLTSCHGSIPKNEFVAPEGFDTSQNYEITFWAKNDTNANQTKVYEQAIREFEALYPNVKVKLKLYTDYARIYQDVITNISTDTTPNVCITYPDHIATYMSGSNTVVPLNDLMNNKKYGLGGSEVKFDSPTSGEIIPQFLEECAFGDTYYALPFMRSTEACYVNKTFVEQLGFTLPETLTWDFIWEVSEAATAKNADGTYKINDQKVMIPFIYKSTDNMMIQMLKQKNAGYSNVHGEIQIFNDTTKELLYTVAEHVKSGAFSTFKISSYPANFLNAGQCIFAIDSTAGAAWMGTAAPHSDISEENIVEFELEVMTIPQFDTENPKMISQGPSVCIFNKEDPQVVMASWLFTQYLLTNTIQLGYASTEGYVPVTSKAQGSEEYLDYLSRCGEDEEYYYDVKIKASQLLLDNMDNTFITPVFNGSASLRNAAGEMIESVVKSIRRKETVDDAYMEDLYADMISRYHFENITGDMPAMSIVLISAIGAAWVFIITYFGIEFVKKSRK